MDGKKIGRQYSDRRNSLDLAKVRRKKTEPTASSLNVVIEEEDSGEMVRHEISNDTLELIQDAMRLSVNRNSKWNPDRNSVSEDSMKATGSNGFTWTPGCAGHPVWGENLLIE